MERSPRYEIPVYGNFAARRIRNARQQPVPESASKSKKSTSCKRVKQPAAIRTRGARTAAILFGEALFLTTFIGIVTVWNLTDTQSAIVAISLAATIVLLVREWCPKWAKLLTGLLKSISTLKG